MRVMLVTIYWTNGREGTHDRPGNLQLTYPHVEIEEPTDVHPSPESAGLMQPM